jgi:hypothetical protein
MVARAANILLDQEGRRRRSKRGKRGGGRQEGDDKGGNTTHDFKLGAAEVAGNNVRTC